MGILRSNLSAASEDFRANTTAHDALMENIRAASDRVLAGGGDAARERHLSRGKLLPRDRVAGLLDPGSPFLEIGHFAAHGLYGDAAPSAGVIAGAIRKISIANKIDFFILSSYLR